MDVVAEFEAERESRYLVEFVDGPLKRRLPEIFASRPGILVTTPTVERLFRSAIQECLSLTPSIDLFVVETSEVTKTIALVERICARAHELALGRDAALVSLGGGVCSDVTTVAASLFRRGIEHIRVPTTLVGQVDAGVGVKGAVNFAGKKNSLGCFHAPSAVYIDPKFLSTLRRRDLVQGASEILKVAIALDRQLFDTVEERLPELYRTSFQPSHEIPADYVIRRSIEIMVSELNSNAFETGVSKRAMDSGHTFSPGVEAASKFSISHGEAVSLDLAYSAFLSCELGILGQEDKNRIVDSLRNAGLPVFHDVFTVELVEQAFRGARANRGGGLNLPVPSGIGSTVFLGDQDLHSLAIRSALKAFKGQGSD